MTAGSVLGPQIIPLRISVAGKAKHEIDTNTLVAIKSGTPDVATIYYTTDGKKPQLFNTFRYEDHNTSIYKEPITLPDGKIIVRALAVTKDGRQSSIVTKTFVVKKVALDTTDEDERFLKELFKQEVEAGLSDLSQKEKNVVSENKINGQARELELQDNSTVKRYLPSHRIGPQVLKNYLNCTSDKEESYLTTWMPPSQVRLCLKCQSVVPGTSPICLVCEAVMVPQVQTQANTHLKGKELCHACGAGNPDQVKLCVICGNQLLKTHMYETLKQNNSWETWQQPTASSTASSSSDLLRRKEQGTQTVGLFYPSIKVLDKQADKLLCQKEKHNRKNDHKPLLTTISPGRGYWRKQLDHVCAHLRSYAQNNLEFRTLIGEPQMGKLTSAAIRKDSYEVSLQINYALAKTEDILSSKPVAFGLCTVSPCEAGQTGLNESQGIWASDEKRKTSGPKENVKRMVKIRKHLEGEDSLTTWTQLSQEPSL